MVQEKINENKVVDSLVKQSEVRRKIAEEVREFKTSSKKLSENKFFKIEYEKGNKQLIINENHQLYKDINKEKSVDKIKKIFELLFISFDQTIQLFDSEENIKVADFEDMLIHNWSIILKNYLKNNMSNSPWKKFSTEQLQNYIGINTLNELTYYLPLLRSNEFNESDLYKKNNLATIFNAFSGVDYLEKKNLEKIFFLH